jgi:hypothetical protein
MGTPKRVIAEAEVAALAAMKSAKTTPMTVQQHASPFNDASPVVKSWHVPEGPCGFAWVHISPARGPIVAELKKQGKGHKSYHGGWDVSMVHLTQTQSVEIKEAGARAYAEVLKANGVTCYADSRLD